MQTSATVEKKTVTPTGCCPPFDPEPWEGRELHWQDKLFLKDHVRSLSHVPLNMGRRMVKDVGLIEAAQAEPPQPFMLSEDVSPWRSDLYIEVTKPVPGAEMTTLSGTYLTKVFEGPYREMGTWAERLEDYVEAQGHLAEKLYFAYVMCPSCAKAYGKNYVLGVAKLREPV
jgi:hypothetical protein